LVSLADTGREMTSLLNSVHYVIAKANPGKLGYVKLNKILWHADLEHYRRHFVSMTGLEQYARMPHGPMAKEINQAVGSLVRNGKVAERTVTSPDYTRREMFSLTDPDVSIFTNEQIEILKEKIEIVVSMTASQLREATRNDPIWSVQYAQEMILVGTGSLMTSS
jgi:Protein of unknown function (DUF4065)